MVGYLEWCVLSVCVTLWNKSPNEGVPLREGGLDPVSVVFTGGLGTLRLIWSDKSNRYKSI